MILNEEQQMLADLAERIFADKASVDTLRAIRGGIHGNDYDHELWQAMGWQPLAMVSLIVTQDRPFTHLVTAQQTAGHPVLEGFYPLEAPGDDWGWSPVTDDRPMSGVLSNTTSPSNALSSSSCICSSLICFLKDIQAPA